MLKLNNFIKHYMKSYMIQRRISHVASTSDNKISSRLLMLASIITSLQYNECSRHTVYMLHSKTSVKEFYCFFAGVA